MKRLLVLLAACGPSARPAAQPPANTPSANRPSDPPPSGACVGNCGAAPDPTQSIADFVAQNGHLVDPNGTYAFSSRADGCTIELTWDASMHDGSTLNYVSTFDLSHVHAISIEGDPETHKDCIKVVTGNKSVHMQIQANIPGNDPIDTPMDDDSWGVCTDQRSFLDGLSTAVRTSAIACHAPLH